MEILDDRSVIYQLEVYKKWYEEQQEEIERLNNIIDELEKDLDKQINFCSIEAETTINNKYCIIALNYLKSLKNKLKELKGSDKEN